jgi:predicted metalloprotease
MSVTVRVLVGILASLALLAGSGVLRPAAGGSAAQRPRPYAPFPASVTVRSAPLPEFANSSWTRVQQMVSVNDAMWREAFAEAGARYRPPKLVPGPDGACSPGGAWAGVYCGRSEQIVIDLNAHLRRFATVGGGYADLILGYIVAHEVGHHVQTLRGAPRVLPARELHADCLAGAWGKAAGFPLPPTWAYGEDAAHGTVVQRIEALNVGYRSGRPAACDELWPKLPAATDAIAATARS